jgi:hypothetical protein
VNLYKIEASDYGQGDYKSIILIAENEERALAIAKKGQPYDWKDPEKYDVYWEFTEEQYPLKVKTIYFDKEKVLISELIGS